jgi:hypothetical protein
MGHETVINLQKNKLKQIIKLNCNKHNVVGEIHLKKMNKKST